MSNAPLALVAVALCGLASAAAGPASAKTLLPGFHSPTGNIRCVFLNDRGGSIPGMLRCKIDHADYSSRLQARCMGPRGAGVDWHGFELSAGGKGQITCSGGILFNPATERPKYVNLPYGRSWRQGVFTCRSRTVGVSCLNGKGHGLFIARESWRAW